MTGVTNPQLLDGAWRIWTSEGKPVVHPSTLAELRRGGYVPESGPVRLTARGRELIRCLQQAHSSTGTPLPPPFDGGDGR